MHGLLRFPPFFLVYLCANVGLWGATRHPLAALPAPFSVTLSLALWVYLCTNVGS